MNCLHHAEKLHIEKNPILSLSYSDNIMDDCQKTILDCKTRVVFITVVSTAGSSYLCLKVLLTTAKFILKQIHKMLNFWIPN